MQTQLEREHAALLESRHAAGDSRGFVSGPMDTAALGLILSRAAPFPSPKQSLVEMCDRVFETGVNRSERSGRHQ